LRESVRILRWRRRSAAIRIRVRAAARSIRGRAGRGFAVIARRAIRTAIRAAIRAGVLVSVSVRIPAIRETRLLPGGAVQIRALVRRRGSRLVQRTRTVVHATTLIKHGAS
jgi:hypothetical protein